MKNAMKHLITILALTLSTSCGLGSSPVDSAREAVALSQDACAVIQALPETPETKPAQVACAALYPEVRSCR